jgi:hypothetical protein
VPIKLDLWHFAGTWGGHASSVYYGGYNAYSDALASGSPETILVRRQETLKTFLVLQVSRTCSCLGKGRLSEAVKSPNDRRVLLRGLIKASRS